jgi:hypothetical protein
LARRKGFYYQGTLIGWSESETSLQLFGGVGRCEELGRVREERRAVFPSPWEGDGLADWLGTRVEMLD